MSKPVKDVITQQYESQYGQVDSACVVNVIGLDAISTNKLRSELKAKKIRLQVVRNSLARRALDKHPLSALTSVLDGPCAIVTGGESAIDVAKTLVGMKKAYPKLELKIGMIDGDPDVIDVERMAKLKSRVEVLGDVAMLIASPGRRLAGCINAPGAKIAGCIKAIIEKAEQAEGADQGEQTAAA